MKNILQLKDVSKTFPNTSFKLNNISFSIPYGSIVGFIGENGAGKTTTMGTILGTLKKDSGTITLFGNEMEDSSFKMKEYLGAAFDQMNFSGNLNVAQLSNVLGHIYEHWDEEKFFNYIEHFSLPLKEIKGFSRGMSMKLSIAVALSHDARLLVLDEATAGLDPVAREEVIDMLADFAKDKQHAILLSSHMTNDMEQIADQFIFIKKGVILLQVSKEEVHNHYAIVKCHQQDFEQIDKRLILAYRTKVDQMEVLVSDKQQIPSSFQPENSSLDDIVLLLMKGEHHERSDS